MQPLKDWKKSQAKMVVELFGGVRATGRVLGLSAGAVSKWKTSGMIPSKHHKPLLDAAKAARKRLTPEMLILGSKA